MLRCSQDTRHRRDVRYSYIWWTFGRLVAESVVAQPFSQPGRPNRHQIRSELREMAHVAAPGHKDATRPLSTTRLWVPDLGGPHADRLPPISPRSCRDDQWDLRFSEISRPRQTGVSTRSVRPRSARSIGITLDSFGTQRGTCVDNAGKSPTSVTIPTEPRAWESSRRPNAQLRRRPHQVRSPARSRWRPSPQSTATWRRTLTAGLRLEPKK